MEQAVDAAPFYMMDPTKAHEASTHSGGEEILGTTRPSAILVLPSFLLYTAMAIALTYASALFTNELAIILKYVPGFGGASESSFWYIKLLALIWLGSLAPVFWEYLVLKTTSFTFSTQRVYYNYKVLNRKRDQIEIARIRDLSVDAPFWQRPFGLGYVTLITVDKTHPELIIPGQKNAAELKDWIHQLNSAERVRTGYREFDSGSTE